MKSGKTNGAEGAALVVSSFFFVGVGVGVGAIFSLTFRSTLVDPLCNLFNALALPASDRCMVSRLTVSRSSLSLLLNQRPSFACQ